MYQKESHKGMDDNMDINLMVTEDGITNVPMTYMDSSLAFTPTTLTSMQSVFSEFNEDISTRSALKSESAAEQLWGSSSAASSYMGDDDDDDDSSQDSNGNLIQLQNVKQEPAFVELTSSGSLINQASQKPPRKLPGPRPSKPIEEMTPLEAERRRRRRERNKNAAAKCRQRRVEVTNELLAETERLENESCKLEREIEYLRRQKTQLEYVLDAHKPTCQAGLSTNSYPSVTSLNNNGPVSINITSTNSSISRPNSLAISNPTTCRSELMMPVTSIDSAVFNFDIHTSLTGLTPLLGGDTPVILSPSTLIAQ